jgi:NHS family xanthosine MFS transporter
MPTLTGIMQIDGLMLKIIRSIHILYAGVLFYIPQVATPETFIYIMLLAMCFYMPTIALSNSISYNALN